jgi:hypothetical protein
MKALSALIRQTGVLVALAVPAMRHSPPIR